ncbi:MAG: hypothetical protein EHM13_13235 [Acidobacteria bacterium]|nr:MAG: hypothetical protein EHM13_13235 [Acidobacteriota bacterium]
MVFIPPIANPALAAARAKREQRQPSASRQRHCGANWGAAILVGVVGAALGPVFAALLGGIHGDLAAGLVILVLGSAGLGFGIGKAIGRQH